MRILLAKFKNIGDTLILTPTVRALRAAYPDCELWLAVRQGTEGILAGCAGIDRAITSKPPATRWGSLSGSIGYLQSLVEVRGRRFDWCFDLGGNARGRWLALASGAGNRAANSWQNFAPVWKPFFNRATSIDFSAMHQAESDFRFVSKFLPLGNEIPPLQFARAKADFGFVERAGLDRPIVVHPATRWKRKQWPLENWVAVCRHFARLGRPLVLSSGPDAEEISFCDQMRAAVPELRYTGGALTWPQMAGLFYAARLFVGVDTAAMHLAAACQLRTVALFGPSVETHWRPWRVEHALVFPPGGAGRDPRERTMAEITVESVVAACEKWAA